MTNLPSTFTEHHASELCPSVLSQWIFSNNLRFCLVRLLNISLEISGESEDSGRELEIKDQNVLHTWRSKPRERCPIQNLLRLSPRDGSEHGAYLIWRRSVQEAKKRCTKLKRLHRGFNFPNNRWKTWEKKAVYLRWDTPQRQLGLVLRQWCHLWIITTAKFVINIFHPKSLLKLKKWWVTG